MNYPELITFFAANKVADIRGISAFTAYCAANLESLGFRDALDKTEMAKKDIEARLDSEANAAAQLRRALNLLDSQLKLNFDRYYALIAEGYKPQWSTAQQNYFEHATRIIHSGNYFFLSFTDRSPEIPGDKPVNRRYKYFIRSFIERPSLSDRKQSNLLAETVNMMMLEKVKGFYYKNREKNAEVLPQLREACHSSLVFVQLVDTIMFDPANPNFCEFEYRQALDFIGQLGGPIEKRVLFLVTETAPTDLPNPERVHQPYKDWLEHILRKSAVYLPAVEDNDKPAIAQVRQMLSEVVKQVKDARETLFEAVPE